MAVKKVLVCGGGNGAHCLAGLASSVKGMEVKVLTLFLDEAETWAKACDENKGIEVTGGSREVKAKPLLITKDPAEAAKDVNIIFLVVPAFAHAWYLNELSSYIQPNTLIVGLPGQAGFEFQCLHILGKKAKQCAIMSFETLPWACRLTEFGKKVQVLGYKETLGAGLITGSESKLPFDALQAVQEALGEKPKVDKFQNYILVNLMAKSIIHPPLMYGKWSKWDGKPLDEIPLFYQGIDENQADMLSKISDELIAVGKAIEKQRPDIKMSENMHILDWFKKYYTDQIADSTNLMTTMRTLSAYDGLRHPMKTQDDGKFVPDFGYRYTREDIPYGLVVLKGIAEIAGVKTPMMDEVIMWCQGKLEKEYIVDGELKGKDVESSRAPQSYGFKTLDDLFNV